MLRKDVKEGEKKEMHSMRTDMGNQYIPKAQELYMPVLHEKTNKRREVKKMHNVYMILILSVAFIAFVIATITLYVQIQKIREVDDEEIVRLFNMNLKLKEAAESEKEKAKFLLKVFQDTAEYQMLCSLIECEAGGEPREGKKEVARVIINRIKSKCFPDTLHEVISEKNQFSSYGTHKYYDIDPSPETEQMLNEALLDPETGQALFFINPNLATKEKLADFEKRYKYLYDIGNHRFYTLKGEE